MRDGAFVAAAGIVLGLIGASATTRLIEKLLFAIPPKDSVTFAAVSIVLLLVLPGGHLFSRPRHDEGRPNRCVATGVIELTSLVLTSLHRSS